MWDLPKPGIKPCPLHRQVDSQTKLDHQGSPRTCIFKTNVLYASEDSSHGKTLGKSTGWLVGRSEGWDKAETLVRTTVLRMGAQSISTEAPFWSALMTSVLEILVWRWFWQEPGEKEGCLIQARHEGFLQGEVCYLEITLQRGPGPTTYSLAGG